MFGGNKMNEKERIANDQNFRAGVPARCDAGLYCKPENQNKRLAVSKFELIMLGLIIALLVVGISYLMKNMKNMKKSLEEPFAGPWPWICVDGKATTIGEFERELETRSSSSGEMGSSSREPHQFQVDAKRDVDPKKALAEHEKRSRAKWQVETPSVSQGKPDSEAP